MTTADIFEAAHLVAAFHSGLIVLHGRQEAASRRGRARTRAEIKTMCRQHREENSLFCLI